MTAVTTDAATWAEWTWPDWVPAAVREQVEGFWSDDYRRGPQAWLRDMKVQHAPPFGEVVTLGNGFGVNPPPVTGRYVHAWNNIGRLVLDDGTVACTAFGPGWATRQSPSPATAGTEADLPQQRRWSP
jgi:hypothetical protein